MAVARAPMALRAGGRRARIGDRTRNVDAGCPPSSHPRHLPVRLPGVGVAPLRRRGRGRRRPDVARRAGSRRGRLFPKIGRVGPMFCTPSGAGTGPAPGGSPASRPRCPQLSTRESTPRGGFSTIFVTRSVTECYRFSDPLRGGGRGLLVRDSPFYRGPRAGAGSSLRPFPEVARRVPGATNISSTSGRGHGRCGTPAQSKSFSTSPGTSPATSRRSVATSPSSSRG